MKKAFPILAVLTTLLLAYAFYEAMWVAPTELNHGRRAAHLLLSRSLGMDGVHSFFREFRRLGYLSDAEKSQSRCRGVGQCGSRRRFLYGRARDRAHLGASGLGHLVNLDLRLTLTLVLWLIYVSYLILRRFSDSAQTPKLAAVLAIFGALDVPLVYFSIWFFRTQHPQPVIGGGGSIDPRMLHVLLINWLAFSCFAFLICWALLPARDAEARCRRSRGPGIVIGSRSHDSCENQGSTERRLAMNSIKFLYAAYIATWVIQGLYIVSVVSRWRNLRRRMIELTKSRK